MSLGALRSIEENVTPVYLSLTKVSSIESCCESLSSAVGAWKVIGTLSSEAARATPICEAVQNGLALLVKNAYLAPAGGVLSLVAALILSASSNSLVGRNGFSPAADAAAVGAAAAAAVGASGAGAAVGSGATVGSGAGAAVGAAAGAAVGAAAAGAVVGVAAGAPPHAASNSVRIVSSPRNFRQRCVAIIGYLPFIGVNHIPVAG